MNIDTEWNDFMGGKDLGPTPYVQTGYIANATGFTTDTVRRLIDRRKIEHIEVSGRYRVRKDIADDFIKALTEPVSND